MLKRAYDILAQFREYLLVSVYLAAAIALLAVNDTPQIRSIRSLTIVAAGFLQDTFAFLPNYFTLSGENHALRELNLTLSDEVNRLREARLENIRLRRLLGLKEHPVFRPVAASVVGKNLQLLRNTITVDVGSADGVQPNMPIVTEEGLVGKVIAAGAHYAIGQILLNKDLRVSAKIQRSRVDGIIRWDGGATLTMQNVVKTMDVQAGDVVITSAYSSLFPAGIRIGVVSSARQVQGSLFQIIDVSPAVDFLRLEEVAIVTAVPDSSRLALERRFLR
jgi:rod shape-determining protein MreC